MEKITIKNAGKINFNPDGVDIEAPSYADVYDGYHTIEELYDHRITLYIALCRYLQKDEINYRSEHQGTKDPDGELPWRSKLHHDGTGYNGWFILGFGKEPGRQITYHIPMSRWDETDFAETFEKAPVPFDGHTSADVLKRIKSL